MFRIMVLIKISPVMRYQLVLKSGYLPELRILIPYD